MANGNPEEAPDGYIFNGHGEHELLGPEELAKAPRAPDEKVAKFVNGPRMIASSNLHNIIQLPDQGGMAFVYLMARAQLAVLVVAHAVDATVSGQQQSIEHTTGNLVYRLMEGDGQRS